MSVLRGRSYDEIAYEVCSAFDRIGVVAVLVGGGAATFYAPNAYQTRDLDFVVPLELFGMPAFEPLAKLGFEVGGTRGTYIHCEIPFTLEVMEGPLGVGGDVLSTWSTCRMGDLVLHVLSPTDSVRDRLAAAIHYGDLSSAHQAAAIAKLHAIDMDLVREWCTREGGESTFRMFEALIR